jgi:predicted ATPase/class 3 adenylate cyclase
MAGLPSGTVTFLFTDVEGSTRLWEQDPEAMRTALARHDQLLRAAIEAQGGHVVKSTGDGVHAVFAVAGDAVQAAMEVQLALHAESWAMAEPLRVRMGLHSGTAELRDGDYFGSVLNRAARLMAVAHGGQVVVSGTTADLVADADLAEVTLRDLGEHRLRDLARPERVWQVCRQGLPGEFGPLRSLDSLPGNLPLQTTAFVGREEQLAHVCAVLGEARVVTLTGVGGVGKTRLALQVAAEATPHFRHGAWLCELAPVGSPDAIPGTLASALGVQPRLEQTIEESLVDYLRSKQALIVLDNCEHLLEPAARLVDRVVHECAQVTVLATSREGLGFPGERNIAVRSLALPAPDAPTESIGQTEAVRLFVDRSADARDGFALTPDNSAAVVQVCRRLDGIPLAIELAAARVQSMKPQEIAARLDDQFRLLRGGRHTSVERHQTLRRAIDWSHDLLSDDERSVLRRLSVFAGGCTLGAAEAVTAGNHIDPLDVLDHLSTLVRRSLLIADDDGAETRYRLLETIRQYAHEQLEGTGEADTIQARHTEYYTTLAEDGGPHLRAAEQLAWIDRLAPELDNLRAGLDWAIDHDRIDLAARLILPLCVNGISIGSTALDWAETLARNPAVDEHPLGPSLLAQAAWRTAMRVDYDAAEKLDTRSRTAEQALGVAPHPADYQAHAFIASAVGRVEEAAGYAQVWIDLARARGDRYELSQGLAMLGALTNTAGDNQRAIALLQEAEAEARRVANPSNVSWTLTTYGMFLSVNDPEAAVPILREAIETGTTVGNQQAVGLALTVLGWVEHRLGNHRAALAINLQANEQLLASGFSGGPLIPHLQILAEEFLAFDEPEVAAICQGAADQRMATGVVGPAQQIRDETLARITAALGQSRLDQLLARAATMTDDEIVDYARTHIERILTN